jgi:hypothetical protein
MNCSAGQKVVRVQFGRARQVELKGLSGQRGVNEVLWEQVP